VIGVETLPFNTVLVIGLQCCDDQFVNGDTQKVQDRFQSPPAQLVGPPRVHTLLESKNPITNHFFDAFSEMLLRVSAIQITNMQSHSSRNEPIQPVLTTEVSQKNVKMVQIEKILSFFAMFGPRVTI